MLGRQWQESGRTQPTIVTVSFGPDWMLIPRGWAPRTGLRKHFLREALPRIEQGLDGASAVRILLGEFMGGFNAIQLLDSGLFSKAAIFCLSVYKLDYPLTLGGAIDLARRTGMEYKVVMGYWWQWGDYVQSEAE